MNAKFGFHRVAIQGTYYCAVCCDLEAPEGPHILRYNRRTHVWDSSLSKGG